MNKVIIIVIIALLSLTTILLIGISKKNKDLKQSMTTKQMMYIVALGSLATVVGFFEIPIGIIGVKLDLSEVIILISFFVLGFKNTSFVIILRSLTRILMPAKTGAEADFLWKLLGEAIAIIASMLIIFSYYFARTILKRKQKPLFYAVSTNSVSEKISMYFVLPVLSAIFLTVGMTIFHTFFTMPLYLSGYQHLTIFSFLKDPNYNANDVASLIKMIITMFGLANVVKGALSPLVFLFVKPQIERIVR